jgi:hypothetical protein
MARPLRFLVFKVVNLLKGSVSDPIELKGATHQLYVLGQIARDISHGVAKVVFDECGYSFLSWWQP